MSEEYHDKKLISFLTWDITELKKGIINNPFSSRRFKPKSMKYEILNIPPLLDFEFFLNKVADNCFQPRFFKDEQIDINFEERAQCINNVFLLKKYQIESAFFQIHNQESTFLNIKYQLYLNLLYTTFLINTTTNKKIETIFSSLHDEWVAFIENETIFVSFIMPLPRILIPDIEIFKDVLYLKDRSWITIESDSSESFLCPSLLIYRRELGAKLYKSMEERNNNYINYEKKYKSEFLKVIIELREIIATLYINDIDFESFPAITILPWWFGVDIEEYQNLRKNSLRDSLHLNKEQIAKAFDLYPRIVRSKLFSEEKYINFYHNYMQLFNREFIPDSIKDIFIIYEFLFIRRQSQDIAFQFSFNASLFLAENSNEFIKYFRFFKKSYRIRSALIHGDEWQDYLDDFIQSQPEFNHRFDLIYKWQQLLNKALRKFINLIYENPNILDEIDQLDTGEDALKRIKFLKKLCSYYFKKKEYSHALKSLYKALSLAEKVNTESLIDELKQLIKSIYSIKPTIIVYSDELSKIYDELKIIEELEIKKSKGINELITLISEFGIGNKLPTIKIKLNIDGNDIMRILGIPQSKKVGEIKQLLRKKILANELQNQQEELFEYIRINKEELT